MTSLAQFGKRAWRRLRRLGAQVTGQPRLRARLNAGPWIEVRLNDQLGRDILRDESFEDIFRREVVSALRPGMTALDIGANFGYYSVLFAQAVGPTGRVMAFEPNPVMLTELKHNLALNQFTHVTVQPIALGESEGELEFCCPTPGREGHGSLRPNPSFTVQETIRVRCRTLDAVCDELGLSTVDVIKLDAEGAELLVFKGATRLLSGPRRPRLYFECSELLCQTFGHSAFDVLSRVSEHGYALRQIDHSNWAATPRPTT
ncbi:MAG: FkbM family methyltransferase [Limisphaerales bacterium]